MRHDRWINFTIKKARESQVSNFKHAAVLVRSGSVLVVATNNDRPAAAVDPIFANKFFHAEIAALFRFLPEDVDGAIMYVAGLSKAGNLLNSKPCLCCQQIIRQYPLKALYYCDRGDVRQLCLAGAVA